MPISKADAKILQAGLNALGYVPRLDPDGIVGRKTQNAVRWFQAQYGGAVDGVPTAKTLVMVSSAIAGTIKPTAGVLRPAVAELFFGLGNAATDRVTGEPLLAQKLRAQGVDVPPIWNYTDQAAGARAILAHPQDILVFAIAISCGANGLATLIREVAPRKLDGVYAIAPSVYCNDNQPAIGDNAPNFWVFNGPYLSLPLPGLSAYQPQRAPGSKAPAIIRRMSYTSHPCDFDVENVQNPILADIKRIRSLPIVA